MVQGGVQHFPCVFSNHIPAPSLPHLNLLKLIVDAEAQKPIESIGPQFLSTKRSAPYPAFKSRQRFGSLYDT